MEIYEVDGDYHFGQFYVHRPVLVVVNVPAKILAQPIVPVSRFDLMLAVFTVVAAFVSWVGSRAVFTRGAAKLSKCKQLN